MLKAKINIIKTSNKVVPLNKNGSVLDLDLLHILFYVLKQQQNKNFSFNYYKDFKIKSLYDEKKLLNQLKFKHIKFLRSEYNNLRNDFLNLNLEYTKQQKKSKKDINDFIKKYKINKGISEYIPYIYNMNFYSYFLKYFNKLENIEFQIKQKENNIKYFETYYKDFKPMDKINEFDIRQFKKGILTQKANSILYFYFNIIKKSNKKAPAKTYNLKNMLAFNLVNQSELNKVYKINIENNFKEFLKNDVFELNKKLKNTIFKN